MSGGPGKDYRDLRSNRWLAAADLRSFGRRSHTMQMGYDRSDWDGKPVFATVNAWSDINQCHQQSTAARCVESSGPRS